LKEIGFSEIRERLYFLSHRLNLELEKIGFNPAYPGKQMSAILAVDNDEIDSFELHSHLKKKSIITALRMEKVRFSPHIYISPAQIDRVVEVIGTYKDKSL
jgi:selenocysteine lyase/cysteine desulfurase